MTEPTTEQRARMIVIKYLEVPAVKVTDNAHLQNDLGADSLERIELIMAFEEEFNITVPDADLSSISTFGDLVAYIDQASQ